VRHSIRAILFGFGLLCVAAVAVAAAGPSTPLEIEVKAAFLAKFAAYVNWPPGTLGAGEAPIYLCVVGRDPFGAALDQSVAGQRVDIHPFVVRRLSGTASAAGCHIAFLGGSATQSVAAMQDALRGKPILTVTDADVAPDRGIVHFELKGGRVRFHIDDVRAAQGNLAISARLLSLALSVKSRTQPS
jgi:hypothetical protein